jgi:hypothetical protein
MEEKRKLAKKDIARQIIDALEKKFISDTRDELLNLVKGKQQ